MDSCWYSNAFASEIFANDNLPEINILEKLHCLRHQIFGKRKDLAIFHKTRRGSDGKRKHDVIFSGALKEWRICLITVLNERFSIQNKGVLH